MIDTQVCGVCTATEAYVNAALYNSLSCHQVCVEQGGHGVGLDRRNMPECFGRNTWMDGSSWIFRQSCKGHIMRYRNGGARGGTVVWGTALQAGRSRVRLFIDRILPAALWPMRLTQPLTKMSTRNNVWAVKAACAYDWQPYRFHVSVV
jgi:hypothetical protein